MNVNYYETDFGIFPVIVGDDAILAVSTLSTATVVDADGNITADGTTVKAALTVLNQLIGLIAVKNHALYSVDVWNNFSVFLPNVQMKYIDVPETSTETLYNVPGSRIKSVRVVVAPVTNTPNGINFSSRFQTLSSYYTLPNNQCPYGKFNVNGTGSGAANIIHFAVLVTNDSFTDFYQASFTIGTNNGKTLNFSKGHLTSSNITFMQQWFDGYEPIKIREGDPYSPGGYSGEGGGGGSFGFDGQGVPGGFIPSGLPEANSTGFCTIYNPTLAQLKQLSDYLWSSSFDLNMLKKLFNNPMDLILSFHVVPVAVEDGGTQQVGFGMIPTGVNMTLVGHQYVEKDLGIMYTTNYEGITYQGLREFFGGYLDYAPYIKAEIYLPYVGLKPIDIDDIMNQNVGVRYNIDVLSGSCVAYVNKWDLSYSTFEAAVTAGKAHCVAAYMGNAAMKFPVTGGDYNNLISGLLGAAATTAAGIATGGGGAVAGGLMSAASSIVNDSKPQVQKGGAVMSNASFLSQQTPFLILSIPKQCVPENQIYEIGYPIYAETKLKKEKGFVKMNEIHLEGVRATDAELEELTLLLKSGVYCNDWTNYSFD